MPICLDAENLRRGLDADLSEANPGEIVRRYGEVARLLTDTGLLIISTTNSFSLPTSQVVQAIQTLVNPTPVVTIHMAKETQNLQEEMDLTFTGPEDFDGSSHQILELLKVQRHFGRSPRHPSPVSIFDLIPSFSER